MRVAIVGATGNIGTAVLKSLAATPEVSSMLGIARRLPDTTAVPYSLAEWAAVDVAAATSEEEAVARLREAFAGADAVIHLAWLVQPNSQRDLLRRVNVDGTSRVARAAAEAGVPHLIVASSAGAYSPDDARGDGSAGHGSASHGSAGGGTETGDTGGTGTGSTDTGDTGTGDGVVRRDESWPTRGVRTSHYSVDKAAQERVLDEFETAHPKIAVTRIRPALVFQPEAASELQRNFLGRLPVPALGSTRPPALPLPKGLTGMQAVHADDLARACAAIVVRRAAGAFNICADDVLTPQDLADIVDHGRFFELPPRLMRAMLLGGHRTGLVAADEGWIDLALAVPMMDNARAKDELDWEPRHTAAEALRDLIAAMAEGRGAATPPMRPREPDESELPDPRDPAVVGVRGGFLGGTDVGDPDAEAPRAGDSGADDPGATPSARMARDLLGLYLSDHLTGATAGAERIERMVDAYIDTPVYAQLSALAEEVRFERAFLQRLMQDLGLRQRPYRQAVAWAGERVGRLKSNGRLLGRSPLSLVLEAELMRSAVVGKLGVWQTLRDNAEGLGLEAQVFADLVEATRDQVELLDEVHEYARARAFREDRETFGAGPDPDGDSGSERDALAKPGAERPDDVAERPGSTRVPAEHADDLVDEWGEESFPASDPPAHY